VVGRSPVFAADKTIRMMGQCSTRPMLAICTSGRCPRDRRRHMPAATSGKPFLHHVSNIE
jgi:hypothetical protein